MKKRQWRRPRNSNVKHRTTMMATALNSCFCFILCFFFFFFLCFFFFFFCFFFSWRWPSWLKLQMINDVDDTLSIILSFLSPQCSEVCRRWSRINDKQTFAALGMPLCSMCRERPWRDRLIRGVVYYSNMFPMHFGCFNATIASGSSSSFFPHHRWLSDVSMSSSSSSSF